MSEAGEVDGVSVIARGEALDVEPCESSEPPARES